MEDNRFKQVASLKKKDVPHQLHWFLKEDYFSNELLGIYASEMEAIIRMTAKAFDIFQEATEKIIRDRGLGELGIHPKLHPCIYHTWERRQRHPFLLGRFDINGGFDNLASRIIEFNADTFTTLPETMYWQARQLDLLKGANNFNQVEADVTKTLKQLATKFGKPQPVMLGSSLGHPEDALNAQAMLDIGHRAGYQTFYLDLEHVVFSDEGIFYNVSEDEYILADVWYKVIPWDWIFNEEPELGQVLSKIILNDLAIVLNPPYTTIWQNKKFLAYITKHFPNNIIAETYGETGWSLTSYVKKPVYGRIGENIFIKDDLGNQTSSRGDFERQPVVYQKYYPLAKDRENYFYQVGMFHGQLPCALNLRAQDQNIITEDCEFMSHFIL